MKRGDVSLHVLAGGGGWGDPLERDPTLVLEDATVPRTNGRGLYFMLRCGYAPLLAAPAGADCEGVTWFERASPLPLSAAAERGFRTGQVG